MKLIPIRTTAAILAVALLCAPLAALAETTSATPKPKISIAPKTIRNAKYKQDTMIKRSQRHPEATSGNTASGENPSSPIPAPLPSPHAHP